MDEYSGFVFMAFPFASHRQTGYKGNLPLKLSPSITSAAWFLALGTAFASADAGAQEVGSELERQRSRYMGLMEGSLSANPLRRLEALREMRGIHLELGSGLKFAEEIRQRISDELRVQTLAARLTSDIDEEVAEAAEGLADIETHHEVWHIRDGAKKALDERFRDDPKNDPRVQSKETMAKSPAVESMRAAVPARSVNEWLEMKEREIRAFGIETAVFVEQLGSPKYEERNSTMAQIADLLAQAKAIANPLPEALLTSLDPDQLVQVRPLDPEQRLRLTVPHNPPSEGRNFRSALPPMEATIRQFIDDMLEYLHVRIELDPKIKCSPAETLIRTNTSNNGYGHLVAAICDATDSYPVCNGHPHHLLLVPRGMERRKVLPLDSGFAVFAMPENGGEGGTVELFADPQNVYVEIESADVEGGFQDGLKVCITPKEATQWNYRHWRGGMPTREVDVPGDKDGQQLFSPKSGGALSVSMWVAGCPVENNVRLDENGDVVFVADGPHTMQLVLEEQADGSWLTTVRMGVYDGIIPWSNTPCSADEQTYEAADRTHCEFTRNGKPLAAKKSETTVDQRILWFSYRTVEKPELVTVRSFATIEKHRIELPLDGSASRRTVEEPFIEVR